MIAHMHTCIHTWYVRTYVRTITYIHTYVRIQRPYTYKMNSDKTCEQLWLCIIPPTSCSCGVLILCNHWNVEGLLVFSGLCDLLQLPWQHQAHRGTEPIWNLNFGFMRATSLEHSKKLQHVRGHYISPSTSLKMLFLAVASLSFWFLFPMVPPRSLQARASKATAWNGKNVRGVSCPEIPEALKPLWFFSTMLQHRYVVRDGRWTLMMSMDKSI